MTHREMFVGFFLAESFLFPHVKQFQGHDKDGGVDYAKYLLLIGCPIKVGSQGFKAGLAFLNISLDTWRWKTYTKTWLIASQICFG